MRDYISLTKPRITWLILMSTGVGYFFGLRGVSLWQIHWWALLHTIIGTGLIASGTAALNQWYEREADAKMRRTSDRPLPSGRLTAGRALAFGIALAIAGFVELAWFVNLLSAVLGMATLVSYLFLYTPLKQRSWLSTTVGAFPGAMPPMIGFAAASGTLTADAWVLFAILFLWQFPHFYAIAWMYREDYARAGIRMLPVVEPDGHSHRPPDRALRVAADSGESCARSARHVRQNSICSARWRSASGFSIPAFVSHRSARSSCAPRRAAGFGDLSSPAVWPHASRQAGSVILV